MSARTPILVEQAGAPAQGAQVAYGQAPKQSMLAVLKVLMRKHIILGWRRRRIFGALVRTAFSCLIPTVIWFVVPSDAHASTRPVLAKVACPLLGVIFVVSLFIQFVIEIVTDKELKMRYVQQIAGVSYVTYWTSCYLYFLLITGLATIAYLILEMAVAPIYKYSSPILLFLIYMLAFLQAFFCCMIVSTVLSRSKMAGVICSVFAAVVVATSQVLLPMISTKSVFIYALESLIPFVSPLNLLNAVGMLEDVPFSCGFTLDSFWYEIAGQNQTTSRLQYQPSAGAQFFLLIADCIMYGLFAVWFDQVYQGEFGAAKPWNFCFSPKWMCPSRRQARDAAPQELSAHAPALKMVDLVKTFHSHRAVDGMSLEVMRGEIFALLGHNGAGKTTAINCITGMLPMTSGCISVCGVDVKAQLQEARRYMSVCPQDNPLYIEYSVEDHLHFFASLRGVPTAQADADISSSLVALGLQEKRHARVASLSGGQKRRLWVATSLLGGTPMVFLDEPTSGMDPANRRLLWDLLVDMKDLGRCILFTTHYLDEADVLAQRKAVLDKGKVRAVGTSWDLKRQFGLGYHLRVICTPSAPDSTVEALRSLIIDHIKTATEEIVPEEERSHAVDVPRQWSFILPYSELPNFSSMLTALEKAAERLNVIDFAVETTSLEEVFMALGQDSGDTPATGRDLQIPVIVPAGFDPDRPFQIQHPESGLPVQVHFPPEAVVGQQYVFNIPRAQVMLDLISPSSREPVKWITSASAIFGLRWRQVLQRKRSLCATFLVPGILMLFSGWGQASSLKTITAGACSNDPSGCNQVVAIAGSGIGMVLAICLAIALPYFATTMVVDRVQRCTYVATSQGLPLSAYWVGTFLNNYIHLVILGFLVPMCFLIFQCPFYSESAQMTKILTASVWAPVPMLMFAYSISRVFGTAEACSKFMPAICLMAAVIPFLAVYIMTLLSLSMQLGAMTSSDLNTGKTMHFWANLIHVLMCFINPFYCLPGSFAAIGLTLFNDLSSLGPPGVVPPGVDLQFPSLFGSAVALPLIGATALSVFLCVTLASDVDRIKGQLRHLRHRGQRDGHDLEAGERGTATVSFTRDADVHTEMQRVEQLSYAEQAVLYKNLRHTYNAGSAREVRAVRGISLAVARGECFTLLGPNGAGKTTTLDVLTGAIFPPTQGEVSVNGHLITASSENRLAALQSLGNCPQVDPLWPTLTGRQHLLFYGKIKGLPPQLQTQQAASLLKAMGFSDFDADKPTLGYSGGMRRKLSLSIALIGSPPTLLLDEPSAAVDAAAKRHLWRVVRQREQGQTVILTTHSMEEAEALSDRLAIQVKGRLRCVGTPDHIKNTHGAGYQLEVLVSRSATAESAAQTGSYQRQGSFTSMSGGPAPEVLKFISDLCSNAKLLEHHEGRYLFQLPVLKAVGACKGEVSLAALFSWMQAGYEAIGMQDYSISRPSLEQVFIRFSKEQQELEERTE